MTDSELISIFFSEFGVAFMIAFVIITIMAFNDKT